MAYKLPDPDDVGASEYAAIFETLREIEAVNEDRTVADVDAALAVLKEYKEHSEALADEIGLNC